MLSCDSYQHRCATQSSILFIRGEAWAHANFLCVHGHFVTTDAFLFGCLLKLDHVNMSSFLAPPSTRLLLREKVCTLAHALAPFLGNAIRQIGRSCGSHLH
jgi:hypothetical protein